MAKRSYAAVWAKTFQRGFTDLARRNLRVGQRAVNKTVAQAVKTTAAKSRPPRGEGDWIAGIAVGLHGARRFRLYRPPGVQFGEKLPLMVMLHGCDQDAKSFAVSTRMNRLAARERFMVLYPEQDRLANSHGCWNWFDTRSGRAYGEAALIMKAIDQVCLLYPVDRARVAVAGLSAGASMAALLVTRHPERFKAVVMHSGIAPGSANSTLSAVSAMQGRRGHQALAHTVDAMAASWPPLMVIHGGVDRVVAASNGHTTAHRWAAAAGASPVQGRNVQRGKRYGMTVTDFKRRGSAIVTLVEVDRLGHAWSGGAARQPYSDVQGPDASRMAWSFAARQFRA
jgi:poly(hydroxyalkanoate) depolymerase family esterase